MVAWSRVDQSWWVKLSGVPFFLSSAGYAYTYENNLPEAVKAFLRPSNSRQVYLHQIVLQSAYRHTTGDARGSDVLITDHVNGDRLDNRASNLRPATYAQNNANSKRTNKSGYRGVYWQKTSGKYIASISINGKNHHLGLYEKPEDAARAYNHAAQDAFGDYASLNQLPASSLQDSSDDTHSGTFSTRSFSSQQTPHR